MRRDVYILCLIGLFCLSGHAQSDREIFEQMRKEMRAEFAEYQKQNEREYARYLRQTWQEYRLEKGIEPFERPKPDNLPPRLSTETAFEDKRIDCCSETGRIANTASSSHHLRREEKRGRKI